MLADDKIRGLLTGGFLTLLIAMGIGRFAYTPLLPPMLVEYRLLPEQAGFLASVNLFGYLAGAFVAAALCRTLGELRLLTAGLLLSGASTAATGFSTLFPLVATMRFAAGLASAFCFVAASGIVLGYLAREQRSGLAGLYFGGVGTGIVFSGLLAVPLTNHFGASGAWILLGLLSLLLVWPVRRLLQRGLAGPQGASAAGKPELPRQWRFYRLIAAYGLEGFGYIITGTFLVAAARSTFGPSGAAAAWIVAGLAAIPSAWLWTRAARRRGPLPPLIGAHLLQAIGVALPAVFPHPAGVVIGAILFGGTFMGIVTLTFAVAGEISPAARTRAIALLTTIYGVGQIVGPAVAGVLVARTGNYDLALLLAAGAIVAGAVLLLPDTLRPTALRPAGPDGKR